MNSELVGHFDLPKKFGNRPDVIYKTILRSFKKYYLSEFNEITDYRKKKRKITNQSFLIDMSKLFVRDRIPDSPFDDLELFISALVQPKLPSQVDNNPRLSELSKVVGEVLYRFNKSKMSELVLYPQFSFLLKRFLTIPDVLEYIGEKTDSPHTLENLRTQISFLLEKCNIVLSKSIESNFGENQIFPSLSSLAKLGQRM